MKSPEKPIVTQALLYWSGAGNRTRVYYGANAVQPAFGNASPNHCIQMGSSPAQNIITGIPRWDIPVIGAGDRNRTGTPSLAVDFEFCTLSGTGRTLVDYIGLCFSTNKTKFLFYYSKMF